MPGPVLRYSTTQPPAPHFHNDFQELLIEKTKAQILTAAHHSGTVTEGLKPTREVGAEADATPADIMVTETNAKANQGRGDTGESADSRAL